MTFGRSKNQNSGHNRGGGAWGTPKCRDTLSEKGKYRDTARENRQYRDTEKSALKIYIISVTPVQYGPDTTTYMLLPLCT